MVPNSVGGLAGEIARRSATARIDGSDGMATLTEISPVLSAIAFW